MLFLWKTCTWAPWPPTGRLWWSKSFGNSYYFQEPLLYRVIGVIVISSLGLFILTTTQEGKEALKTVIDSRTEIRRVVWPTRTETTQTTLIVLVAITIAALILWGLDSLFGWATAALLG